MKPERLQGKRLKQKKSKSIFKHSFFSDENEDEAKLDPRSRQCPYLDTINRYAN